MSVLTKVSIAELQNCRKKVFFRLICNEPHYSTDITVVKVSCNKMMR